MSRQNLCEYPLTRFRYGVVASIGIGHRNVLFATEVARYIQNRALALVFHHWAELANQRVVGDQIRFHGAVPVRKRHVHHHLFRAGNTRVVNQEIDIAEQLDGSVIERIQGLGVTHINIGHDADPGVGLWIANSAQFFNDLFPRFLQLGLASGAQQYSATRDGEVAAKL